MKLIQKRKFDSASFTVTNERNHELRMNALSEYAFGVV